MVETRNIVFVGASYAGIGSTHYFLRHVYPQLPQDPNVTYKAILIDPSSKWYMRHASPRAAASAQLIPADKIFLDIEPGLKQYGDKVQFIQGKATEWSEKMRNVVIKKRDGSNESISYWALVLATGSKSSSPIYSLQGTDHTDIQAALRTLHDQLHNAKEIVIAGGGPAGVETAGELGDSLNGAARWFASRPANPKVKITVITSASKLLPVLRQSSSDQAELYLNRVGVDVRYNTKISSAKTLPNGRKKIVLHDGEELGPDIYIPAFGVTPMSEYVPKHLKNERGKVIQNNATLRVDAAGPRVYAIGDIGSYSNDSIPNIFDSIPVMETNLKRDLLAAHSNPEAKPTGLDREFKQQEQGKEIQVVPVGRSKGVGAVYGWRVPSWFVWIIKGRDYMVPKGFSKIDGSEWAKEVVWKQEKV